MKAYLAKRALCALFLGAFCFSCAKQSEPHWVLEETQSCNPHSSYKKLHHPSQDPFFGLELEIASGPFGHVLYINTFSLPLQPDPSGKVEITLSANNVETTVYGSLLEGGQRILLDAEAQDLILSNLLNNNYVEVIVGRFRSTISADNFVKQYNYLKF